MKQPTLTIIVLIIAIAAYHPFCQNPIEIVLEDNTLATQFQILDFNQDGKNDIVYNAGNAIYIKEKISSHTFSNPVLLVTFVEHFEFYDMDNDGDFDLIRAAGDHLYFHENTNGVLANPIMIVELISVQDFFIGDFDDDGLSDICAGAGTSGLSPDERLVFIKNQIGNNFQIQIIDTNLPITQHTLGVDCDDDGDLDLMVYHGQIDQIDMYLNDGQANFSLHPNAIEDLVDVPTSLQIVDIDDDGDLDLVYPWEDWSQSGMHILTNNSDLTWDKTTLKTFNHQGSFGRVYASVSDYENDGDSDIFFTSSYYGEIRLMTNNGSGQFTDSLIYNRNDFVTRIASCYVDNDSIYEVVYSTHSFSHEFIATFTVPFVDTSNHACPAGDVIITSRAELQNYLDSFPNCERINGSLFIGGSTSLIDIEDISGLKIKYVEGDLTVQQMNKLPSLEGLFQVEYVGGSLRINNLFLVEDYDQWAPLKHVGGDIYLRGLRTLANLDLISAIDTIHGDFTLWACYDITSVGSNFAVKRVDGSVIVEAINNNLEVLDFHDLSYVGGDFSCQRNEKLETIHLHDSLIVGGDFLIEYNKKNRNIFGKLLKVGGNVVVLHSEPLESLQVFSELKKANDFQISFAYNLSDADLMLSLDSILGRLYLVDIANITSIEFIEHLDYLHAIYISSLAIPDLDNFLKYTSFDGALSINNCQQIVDWSGIENITELDVFQLRRMPNLRNLDMVHQDLFVHDVISFEINENLSYCNYAFICNHIEAGRTIYLGQNATGCNDVEEIMCNSDAVDLTSTKQEIVINPNPSQSSFRIQGLNSYEGSQEVSVFNIVGNEVMKFDAGDPEVYHSLEPGVYFLLLYENENPLVVKFVVAD